jgi:hypothetical protein
MGLEQRLAPRLEQRLELKLRLKLKIQARLLDLRLQLIGKVNDEKYSPHAVCPKCFRRLTPLEIIKGFNRDVNDFTTKCPKCKDRFEPTIICKRKVGTTEVAFYCPSQTLNQLGGKENLPVADFKAEYPAIFHSVTVHFGSLAQAFKKIGINYRFEESVVKWQKKARQFLGLLPDSVIARIVRVKYSEVRKYRLSQNIPRFRVENLL